MSIFAALKVYHDVASRSAAMNMAIDEALLERAIGPSIRFYRWDHPALSFGYFGKYTDVDTLADHRDIVRRWTGGGIVFHGDDLTYSLVIPAHHPAFAESSISIYEVIHSALSAALCATGVPAELASVAAVYDCRKAPMPVENLRSLAVTHRRCSNDACFASPVEADVLVNGRKIAGAAQRRNRLGLLQQGSIQGVNVANDFQMRFADELSLNCIRAKMEKEILDRAREISDHKYSSAAWLRKR
jgi:lipoyl(octanoyl) transferase